MHPLRSPRLRILFTTAALSGALLTTGCAQMRNPGYYSPPNESSRTDADYQGQGGASRNMVIRAPSQIQIGLNRSDAAGPKPGQAAGAGDETAPVANPAPDEDTAVPPLPPAAANARMKDSAEAAAPSAPAAADHPAQRAFLPQAQTYVGTVPCLSPSAQCEAQRITLTLGPNGRWRSRATYLGQGQGPAAAPLAEQGCWNVTGDRPAHLLLLDAQGTARTELVASANNVLTVKSVRGRAPTLPYTLTRQPDLDPIDELAKQALPACE